MRRGSNARTTVPQWQTTRGSSLIGGVLLWAAFPPLNLFPLAWLAPVFWIRLIEREGLDGPRPYRWLWLASGVHFWAVLEGISRAHPANYAGLTLLAAYLGVYLPAFVALTRVAVHRWRTPVIVAAPIVWAGLELARGHLFTGFSMALIGHTQASWLGLIQIADVFGAYGVSFVVVLVAACLAKMLPLDKRAWSLRPLLVAGGVLLVTLAYGEFRLAGRGDADAPTSLKVTLVQGTAETVLDGDIEQAAIRADKAFQEYWELSKSVRSEHPDLDLIVWPESVFTGVTPQLVREGEVSAPPGAEVTDDEYQRMIDEGAKAFYQKVRSAAGVLNQFVRDGNVEQLDIHLLVGTDRIYFDGDRQRTFNAGMLISPDGQVVDHYDKMHRVVCGEYVPLGDQFPWIYRVMPIGRGLTAGDEAKTFVVKELAMTPSICFESTIPHLIRRQVRESAPASGILINLTNDGWFWGSAMLDLQLSCEVFRAVELRRPFLIAANTGISAWIDESGEVLARGAKEQQATLICSVSGPHRTSLYSTIGDSGAVLCLLYCIAIVVYAVREHYRQSRE